MLHKPAILALALIFDSCHASLATKIMPPSEPTLSHLAASNQSNPNEDETPGGDSRRSNHALPIGLE